MKKCCIVFITILLSVATVTACTQVGSGVASGGLPVSSETVSSNSVVPQPVAISSSASISVSAERIVASITSEYKGLSRIDIIADGDDYGLLRLYFELMDWDTLDNETRAEIVDGAVNYARDAAIRYGDSIDAEFEGFTSNGECIFYTRPRGSSEQGFIAITDTDGGNEYTSGTNAYYKVVMSIPSEHEGLSRVEITISFAGYSLDLYFEPMEWNDYDEEKRSAIAKDALHYARNVTEQYDYPISNYSGYTSTRDPIFFNSSSGMTVLMDTNGGDIIGANVYP